MSPEKFNLLVSCSPQASDAHYRAYEFCEQAFKIGKTIDLVFFYNTGALVAQTPFTSSDAWSAQTAWCSLKSRFALTLGLCPGAAKQFNLDEHNTHRDFTLCTLGQFLAAAQHHEVLQFR